MQTRRGYRQSVAKIPNQGDKPLDYFVSGEENCLRFQLKSLKIWDNIFAAPAHPCGEVEHDTGGVAIFLRKMTWGCWPSDKWVRQPQ